MARTMSRRFPVYFALGDSHQFLSSEEAASATTEDRIRSVWPYLCQRVDAFHERLPLRAKANYDQEDIALDLYVHLMELDSKWDGTRGAYFGFASTLIRHKLVAIWEQARIVRSPRNTADRIKAYAKDEEAGELTPRKERSAQQIKSTESVKLIGESELLMEGTTAPDDEVIDRETTRQKAELLSRAMQHCSFSATEKFLLSRRCGLWGQKPQTLAEIAEYLGVCPSVVQKAWTEIARKVRAYVRKCANTKEE